MQSCDKENLFSEDDKRNFRAHRKVIQIKHNYPVISNALLIKAIVNALQVVITLNFSSRRNCVLCYTKFRLAICSFNKKIFILPTVRIYFLKK